MSEIFNQYFDFDVMAEHFGEVLDGFLQNLLELFARGGGPGLIWGLILALLRQLPGRSCMPIRFVDDRLHRRLPRGPAPDHHPDDLRRRPIPHLPAGGDHASRTGSANPTPSGTGSLALVIVYGAYTAEVYRAGIEAVPGGQMEAARSLGMSHLPGDAQRVVPQAVTQDPGADAQRIDLAAQGHDPGQRDRPERGGARQPRQSSPNGLNSSALTLTAIFFVIVILPLARVVDKLIARSQMKITRGSHIEVRLDGGADAEASRASTSASASSRCCKRRRPRGAARRGRLHPRAQRLGQEHAAALRQPARATRAG